MTLERRMMQRQYNFSVALDLPSKESPSVIGQFLLLLGVFFLPFGAGFTNTILLAAAGFMLLSGHWREKLELLSRQKTTYWILLFGILMFVGVFYSGGTSKHAWEGLSKYDKILYFVIFLPLLTGSVYRRLLINVFVISVVLSVIFGSDINPIDSSFLIGFTTFILLRRLIDSRKWRWFNSTLFIFLSIYLLFYNIERTGYLIFFGGLGVVFWQIFRWRGLLLGMTLIISLMVSLFWISPVFQDRIKLGYSESVSYLSEKAKMERSIAEYLGLIPLQDSGIFEEKNTSLFDVYKGKTGLSAQKNWLLNPHAHFRHSSIGLRLGFAQYSWQEIKKHLWLGNGTGSFKDVYLAGGGPKIDVAPLGHPHNEYVLIWFQWGIIGLIVFLMWQLTLWKESFWLPKKEQALLQGLLVCFALLGFCNASLYVNPSGDIFVIMIAILLSSKNSDQGKLCELQ